MTTDAAVYFALAWLLTLCTAVGCSDKEPMAALFTAAASAVCLGFGLAAL